MDISAYSACALFAASSTWQSYIHFVEKTIVIVPLSFTKADLMYTSFANATLATFLWASLRHHDS